MGLKNLLGKKKSKEADAGLVGGLTDTNWETNLHTSPNFSEELQEVDESEESEAPAWPGFSGSAGQATEEQEEEEPQKPEKEEGGAASLDIFSMETGEDEDINSLAKQLPAINIHDLLKECKEMVDCLQPPDSSP